MKAKTGKSLGSHGSLWHHRSLGEHTLAVRRMALYRALIAAGAIFLWQLCTGQGTGIKDAKAELHLLRFCQERPSGINLGCRF